MTRVDVVLFDLDDTLFAHTPASAAAIAELDGDADPGTAFARWHELEEYHYPRYLRGELDFTGQRRARARAFLAPGGIDLDDDQADAWFEGFVTAVQRHWALYDDALPCLDALHDRRIGLITNGDPVYQASKIAAVGLDARIEHLVASGEVGYAKPDPRIFAAACALFGVTPDAAAYVGDRLRTDAIGAAEAGLRGVWLDRDDRATAADRADADAAGVAVIRGLAELPALLA